jgi:hypothetical protein
MAWMGWLGLVMRSSEARAEDGACDLVVVDASPELDPVWQRASDELQAVLTRELIGPECVPARLRLEPSPFGVVVHVQLADGRETSRSVRDRRALVPVVLGLFATAPPEPLELPPEEKTGARSSLRTELLETPLRVSPGVASSSPSAPSPNEARHAVGLTLGLAAGVRAGVPTDMIVWDNELRLDLVLHDWIVFANIRYAFLGEVSAIPSDPDAYAETAVGLGAGREFRWGKSTLDLTASPTVVFIDLDRDSPVEIGGEQSQLRFTAAARYGHTLGAGWRFTVTLDTELAPSSCIKERHADPALPAIPAWTGGLRLGAAANLL